MRPEEIRVGATYIGRRHRVYGRSERRRLERIEWPRGFAPMAHFVELDHNNQRRAITRKSFAAWAVREVEAGSGEGEA